MSARVRVGLSALVCAALVAVGITVWIDRDAGADDRVAAAGLDRRQAADFEFEVPVGTGERIADGDAVDIMPNPLVVKVGDTIRIRNRDRDPILLGPFYVAAHSVVTQRFVAPGRLVGDCVAHLTGRLVVKVRR